MGVFLSFRGLRNLSRWPHGHFLSTPRPLLGAWLRPRRDHSRRLRRPLHDRRPPTPPKKPVAACAAPVSAPSTINRLEGYATSVRRVYLEFPVRRVFCRQCQAVKRERLDWLADNPHPHPARHRVGRLSPRPRAGRLGDFHLHWHTRSRNSTSSTCQGQLHRETTAPVQVIGIDEISIGRGTPTTLSSATCSAAAPSGSVARTSASMDAFYTWLGPEKARRIRLAVMDMWKAFRTPRSSGHAHQARHLRQVPRPATSPQALDTVRKQVRPAVGSGQIASSKGQKYNLLSRWGETPIRKVVRQSCSCRPTNACTEPTSSGNPLANY